MLSGEIVLRKRMYSSEWNLISSSNVAGAGRCAGTMDRRFKRYVRAALALALEGLRGTSRADGTDGRRPRSAGARIVWVPGAARGHAHVYVHLPVQAIGQKQVVRHADTMRLHRMALAIVVVSYVAVIKVRDALLAARRELDGACGHLVNTCVESPRRARSSSPHRHQKELSRP